MLMNLMNLTLIHVNCFTNGLMNLTLINVNCFTNGLMNLTLINKCSGFNLCTIFLLSID